MFPKVSRSDFFRVFGKFGTLLNESNDHGRIDGHNVQIVVLHKIPSNLLYNFFRYCALMHERGTSCQQQLIQIIWCGVIVIEKLNPIVKQHRPLKFGKFNQTFIS